MHIEKYTWYENSLSPLAFIEPSNIPVDMTVEQYLTTQYLFIPFLFF